MALYPKMLLAATAGFVAGGLLVYLVARPRMKAMTKLITLRTAPHPAQRYPSALVHVPDGFDPRSPFAVLVYFRGWNSCVSVIAASERGKCRPDGPTHQHSDIVGQVDRSRANLVLIMPELLVEQDLSDPGTLTRPGALKALIDEVLREHVGPHCGCSLIADSPSRVLLAAHSGGYHPTAVVLDRGGMSTITDVLLLDALYGDVSSFERFVRGGGKLVSIYTDGVTERRSLEIAQSLAPMGQVVADRSTGLPSPEQWGSRVLVHRTAYGHSLIPLHYVEPWLSTRGLPLIGEVRPS